MSLIVILEAMDSISLIVLVSVHFSLSVDFSSQGAYQLEITINIGIYNFQSVSAPWQKVWLSSKAMVHIGIKFETHLSYLSGW